MHSKNAPYLCTIAATFLMLVIAGPCAAAPADTANSNPATNPRPADNSTPAANSTPEETKEQRDARMHWWREAKFGMFIHWGVYSVPAGYYQGKPVRSAGEWIMNRGKIPVADYQAFAKQFNPVKYDPDQWVKLAKDAGMKYIVITAKHHDGFAMFDSKASNWNIARATPYGKDVLKPLAEAARKQGIRLGFYYSQAQDWNNPGGAASGGHWDKAQDGSMDEYLKNVALPQVKEILTNYGPDTPAVLWWDTAVGMNPERAAPLYRAVRELRPQIIMNNRLGGGFRGDTETPEQHIPATGYKDRDWETCMTMNGTWGYKKDDNNWKSTETLIHNLVDIVSKGGNYLLNVGPTSEGLIPEPSVQRLQEIGKWMKVNGEAIYATTASPFRSLPWGRCTRKTTGNDVTLYLHVFNWPADGKLQVPGLKNTVETAYLLSDPTKTLPSTAGDAGVTLTLPAAAPDPISSTVVLKVKGPLQVEDTGAGIQPAADGSLTLQATDATIHGSKLRVEGANLGYWIQPADWADWQITIPRAGKYTVRADIASRGATNLEISVGDSKLKASTPNTGDYKTYRTVDLGTLDLPAGKDLSLQIHPITTGWHPINIRSVKLIPAG